MALGLTTSGLEEAFFGLTLPMVPAGIWTLAQELFPDLDGPALDKFSVALTLVTESCWRIGVALYFHAVWRWRVSFFDPRNNVSPNYHRATLLSRLRQGYNTVHLHLRRGAHPDMFERAAQVMRKALHSDPILPAHTPSVGHAKYLLFFDGGSRGNLGPGGSGAAVVRVGEGWCDFEICWVASMSYAATSTTNNVAENMGLLTGLHACYRYKWVPLHVVGDSTLILHQQQKRRPPKAKHLIPLYWRSRRVADQLAVLTWQHHLRSYNKMADALANLAMDTRRSMQCTPNRVIGSTSLWKDIHSFAASDVGHWLERNSDENSSGFGASTP
ncbi:hypothetical protein ON010_g3002 [Phytophthora cinnamomi]|nr:hypothetical protein ON010_g3002 [Phytophthora cinnamomi]